jgi:hypothetical protein
VIVARTGEKLKVKTEDGNSTIIAITEATKVKTSSGLFGGRSKLGNDALLNGLAGDREDVAVGRRAWSPARSVSAKAISKLPT